MSGYRLVVLDGAQAGVEVVVEDALSIGRLKESGLVLEDLSVSRKHAQIVRRSTGMYVEDLGSAHGTTVNGERIQSRELHPGDMLGIGPVNLRVEGETAQSPSDAGEILLVHPVPSPADFGFPVRRSPGMHDPVATAARLEALLRIGNTFHAERDIGRLFRRIADVLLESLDVDRCGIFLKGNPEPELVLSRTGLEDTGALPFSQSLLRRAMDMREAMVTADAGRDRRLTGASLAAGAVRSAMVAPLWGLERVVGAVVVENRGRVDAFQTDDLRLLVMLANMAGTAIENIRLIEEVRVETGVRVALSRFLSPTVAEKIQAKGLKESLVAERREITVLFTDIRGFTSLSETLPPDELLEAMNRVFSTKIDAIFAENGMVDKFTGDGVLAIFGAPIHQPDHAARALQAARTILRLCSGVTTRSGHPVGIGAGIASGEATVGPIGSVRRMEYTAMGDVVNVAARLVAKAEPGEILITAETALAAGCPDPLVAPEEWQVKGRQQPVIVHRIKIE